MKLPIDYLEYNSQFETVFSKNYLNQQPCLIQGLVSQWKANAWDYQTLKTFKLKGEDTGNLARVILKDPKTGSWIVCKARQVEEIRQKLGQMPLEYQANEWLFSLQHPELMEEIEISKILLNPNWLEKIPPAIRPIYPRLLIGYRGTGSQLHIDICNTPSWMALVQGKKRWLIMPPHEANKVEQFIEKFTPEIQTIVRSVETYYECELQAGEMIYLPGKWLHQVFNVEDTIAITYNIFNFFQASSYCLSSLISRYLQK